jgi:hypothetical protein
LIAEKKISRTSLVIFFVLMRHDTFILIKYHVKNNERFPRKCSRITGEGEITGSDYETVLIPAVKQKLSTKR